MTIEQMHALVKLGAEAGREKALLDESEGDERDTQDTCDMPLSTAHLLRTEIQRLEITPIDYGHAIALFTNVYSETIKNCKQAIEGAWSS